MNNPTTSKLAAAFLPDPDKQIEDQQDFTILAMTIWAEARGESQEGRIAAGQVIMNRLIHPQTWWGKTIKEICLKPAQFSCFNESDPNRDKVLEPLKHDSVAVWTECVDAAMDAFSSRSPDLVGGADHYCHISAHPSWRSKMRETVVIGKHVFLNSQFKGEST